jgi:phthiocerol/phenolphthiocerol synthesis type-I polyketide synthase D
MVHTFVGADVEEVRERVRKPFCDYLKSIAPLLKGLAQSRGRELDTESLSGSDLDDFVNFLYERFFSTRALLGTPESCRGLLEQLASIGVDEVACLLDFGPGTEEILASLPHLNRLRELCESIGVPAAAAAPAPSSEHSDERAEGLDDWLYELRWEEAAPAASRPESPGRWIVLADAGGVGARVAALLEEAGEPCTSIRAGEVDLGDAAALGRLLEPDGEIELRGVIHLWALDALPLEQASRESLEAEQRLGSGSALSLMQALVSRGGGGRLWLVTRGAQAVAGESAGLAVSQSPLWGLGRTCAMEHPEIWGGLVDLDPAEPAAESARGLLEVVRGAGGEDQNALRSGRRHVARLARLDRLAREETAELRVNPGASYLITGGLWGLGFEVARWLARRGARRLLLVGRSALPPRESWGDLPADSRAARQVAGVLELEGLGASVVYAALDVADETAVREWWQEQVAGSAAPLRGVVHAASVWQDARGHTLVRPLPGLDVAAMLEVFAPKVTGGFVLDRLCGREPLDFFVCFSSGASLVGSVGQGNYAGASAFLDALAHHRRLRGLAGLSINWGAVSQAGFGATAEGLRLHEHWEEHGIGRITPGHVLQALERFAPTPTAQVGVMRNDWRRLCRAYPRLAALPLMSGLLAHRAVPGGEGSEEPPEFLRKLRGSPARQGRSLLVGHVRDEVVRVLRLAPSVVVDLRRGLFDMGLDSLMALELRSRLQASLACEIPATLVFERPSIEAIAGHLAERLGLDGSPGAEAETSLEERGNGHGDLLERIRGLSDEEVDRQLALRASAARSVP